MQEKLFFHTIICKKRTFWQLKSRAQKPVVNGGAHFKLHKHTHSILSHNIWYLKTSLCQETSLQISSVYNKHLFWGWSLQNWFFPKIMQIDALWRPLLYWVWAGKNEHVAAFELVNSEKRIARPWNCCLQTPSILKNILHTHNMHSRRLEIDLEAFKTLHWDPEKHAFHEP